MEYRKLGNTDMNVSVLSFGASSLGGVFHATDDAESAAVVRHVIDRGINYIDTAPWYGHGRSETVLGKGLRDVSRDRYYVATKVGRYEPQVDKMFNFTAERTLQSVDESLQRLGLEYVDIIQVHDMEFAPSLDIIVNETLPALQKVRDSGKARYIGITGYPLENFKTVLERSTVKIDSILTYCRYSMNDTGLTDYIPYFKSKGVGIVNASPISMGLLSSRGPPDWHPATPEIKECCIQAATYCQEQAVDISKLAMHFSLANTDVHTTLVSSARVENVNKNLAAVTQKLTAVEERVMNTVLERYMTPLNNRHWEGVELQQYRDSLKLLNTDTTAAVR